MMDDVIYKVFARLDNAGRVLAVNSSAFLSNADGWTKIDEGFGDKHHHAQGNYLPGPLMDERGIYRYKLVDGQAVERNQEEMDADYTPPVAVPDGSMESLAAEVAALKESNAQLQEALELLLSGEVDE